MINLGCFQGPIGVSTANGISDTGWVVGGSDSTDGQRAFLWAGPGATMQDLGVNAALGGTDNTASGISPNGQLIVGAYLTATGTPHGYIWNNGAITDTGIIKGLSVNDAGEFVGSYTTAGGQIHAFVSSGVGAGYTDLGTFGGTTSQAQAVNSSGQVVGFADLPSGDTHAFYYSGSGPLIDLGTLSGGLNSFAGSISNSGVVAGTSYMPNDETEHGFLYNTATGGPMIDANTLIDPACGWTIVATAISDNGLIAADGINAAGQAHAILLLPTPEPSALASLVAAVVCLLILAQFRRSRPVGGGFRGLFSVFPRF
jgi:probable HAF family extracellular repeat protein